MPQTAVAFNDIPNPLDSVEDILSSYNWVFNRMGEDELTVNVAGKSCDYKLLFLWQEEMQAVEFCAQYDLALEFDNRKKASAFLSTINEDVWMGHFDIPQDTKAPCFRYTALLRGLKGESISAQLEDMVDIALAQCERYYASFYLLCKGHNMGDEFISLALMDTAGEC